ncbi:Aerobic glycerol-3-phosphate dehydrogenase [hydrothermal vent metagenome]|uniref:Aerobic glycerol-3-phosphate dehydrogenase n=1 Tax=hydrothermal vent metagenome TaxID=652676 RepID=A0A3B0TK38_9ZZZZ
MNNGKLFDIFVIGGGVNGCGIARDAQGRGYSVCLAEKDDLASGTSSGATKLIHGGLRYLEHYEFRLVREALIERERLWAIAPHIIWPLRFVLPVHKGLRPAWLLRLGLFIYDHLGGRKLLPGTKTLDMRTDAAAKPLKPLYKKAFEYSDCWVNDARLVVLNARDAADRGAEILTRTRVVAARRMDGEWLVDLEQADGKKFQVRAKTLVNAAGPWVEKILSEVVGVDDGKRIRLVKGSHIVVKSLFDHKKCYIFQNADGRIIFAIPYEEDFTLIGTTDEDYFGRPEDVRISDEEISYLCNAASEYFAAPVTIDKVVWSYSAVRPLMDDGASKAQEATRDYVLSVERGEGGRKGRAPALISVHGGKITTYRKLAEAALDHVGNILGRRGKKWTASQPLPGGDFGVNEFDSQVRLLAGRYEFLEPRLVRRLVRLYGTKAQKILGQAKSNADLGQLFGDDLYEVEVRYLIENEWARSAEDILWRRTKRGLWFSNSQSEALVSYLESAVGDRHGAASKAAQ